MARIVVADDDESIREILVRCLSRVGHRVAAAGGGGELLDECRRETPDVVILDLALPDADGRELFRRLRAAEETRGVRVVYLTGGAALSAGEALEADAFFRKPFVLRDLVSVVGSLAGPSA
jgi:CheY-like chemotaxis protein